MASDSQERGAIERVAKRLKEHGEREGKRKNYEHYVSEARKVAIEHDKRQGK